MRCPNYTWFRWLLVDVLLVGSDSDLRGDTRHYQRRVDLLQFFPGVPVVCKFPGIIPFVGRQYHGDIDGTLVVMFSS